jgi:hypothetical protein
MSYTRVIPRDLFNEAKLLKCLGQLVLLKHDGKLPASLEIEHDDSDVRGFDIMQDESDGGLECANLTISINSEVCRCYCPYNCKSAYPLQCQMEHETLAVFNDNGTLSDDFRDCL